MHHRALQNSVLFSQHRALGFRCTWTGLKKMAVHELVMVCTSTEDEDTLDEGFALFFQDSDYCYEDFTYYLVHKILPKLNFDADIDGKKCRLLFVLFKTYGIETFTSLPSLKEVIHEMLDIYAASDWDVKEEVARDVLMAIAMPDIVMEPNDELHAAISYLTEHRGADVNALADSDFDKLMKCLRNILLYLCSFFSTVATGVFLHTKLDANKIEVLWKRILVHLPENLLYSGSVDVIRLFVGNGFDVKKALYSIDFFYHKAFPRWTPEHFNDLLEVLEIFMDHGARLNPLPGSKEQPFLQGLVKGFCMDLYEKRTRPKLFKFITKCIERGTDPESPFFDYYGREEDLLIVICYCYDGDDKNEVIEYLCDCGAVASLYRNNGADFWSGLSYSSRYDLTCRHLNEALLNLLRRGLLTGCIDEGGNNVLHMYFRVYSEKSFPHSVFIPHGYFLRCKAKGCCRYGWFRSLDELKFWDVLDALLDAGVPVGHVNNKGEIPFDVFKRIMPPGYENLLENVCPQCCQRFLDAKQRGPVNPNAELMKVRKYLEHLSPSPLQP